MVAEERFTRIGARTMNTAIVRFARDLLATVVLPFICLPLLCFGYSCASVGGLFGLFPDAQCMITTLAYSACVTAISLLGGTLCAVWFAHRRDPVTRVAALLLTFPLLLPPAVVAICYHTSLGAASPLVVRWSYVLDEPFLSAVAIATVCYTPLVAWIVWVGLQNVPAAQMRLARLHFSWYGTLWRFGFRFARQEIVVAALIVFLLVLQDFDISNITGLDTLAVEVYIRASNLLTVDHVLAASLPLVAGGVMLALGLTCLIFQRIDRPASVSEGLMQEPRPRPSELGLVVLVTLPVFGGAAVAAWNLIVASRTAVDVAASWRDSAPDLLRSAAFSLTGAGLAVIIAGALLPLLSGRSRLLRGAVLALVLAAFAIPPAIASLSLLDVVDRLEIPLLPQIFRGPARLALVLALRSMPVVLLVIALGAMMDNRRAEQLAAVHRVEWRSRMLRLRWPLIRPHILLAGIFGFIAGMRELELFVLHAPPGATTLTVRIFNALHFGAPTRTAGLCLVLAVASASSLLLLRPVRLASNQRRVRDRISRRTH